MSTLARSLRYRSSSRERDMWPLPVPCMPNSTFMSYPYACPGRRRLRKEAPLGTGLANSFLNERARLQEKSNYIPSCILFQARIPPEARGPGRKRHAAAYSPRNALVYFYTYSAVISAKYCNSILLREYLGEMSNSSSALAPVRVWTLYPVFRYNGYVL